MDLSQIQDKSNCLAELALQIAKGKLAVVDHPRTLDALFGYSAILSCLKSCKKRGVNLFNALKRLFDGNPIMPEEMLLKEIIKRMQEIR